MVSLDLSDDLYIQFRDLLYTRCGLDYPERKRADLAHALGLALRTSDASDFATLYAQVRTDAAAWDSLLTHVTIGETYFFRNASQFAALQEHILPDVLARRKESRGMRLWSAGCASGEEPYSLAMTLYDHILDREQWQLSILGTDINPHFLKRAEAALYSAWSFRETPGPMQTRFFAPEGDHWRLSSEIRRMVRFLRLNLVERCYPAIANGTCALDIIVCRNVTIYFDTETTRQVVARLYEALTPGGWLIVGHAEPQASVYRQFEVHNFRDTVVYRKPLHAPLFAFSGPTISQTGSSTPGVASQHMIAASQSRAHLHVPATPAVPATPVAPSSPVTPPVLELAMMMQAARQAADRAAWTMAEQQCREVLARDPLYRDAHYLMAQIHEQQGQLMEALAAYRRSVYLDRSFVLGTLGMAQVWHSMGCRVDAQRCYRNALKQLAPVPPAAAVPDADGVTYGDLVKLVTEQLQKLAEVR